VEDRNHLNPIRQKNVQHLIGVPSDHRSSDFSPYLGEHLREALNPRNAGLEADEESLSEPLPLFLIPVIS
jgi:hypothetical protein